MQANRRRLAPLVGALAVALASAAAAQGPPDGGAPDRQNAEKSQRSDGLTAKERLSNKASDERRVDDCKVPVEQRGPTLRPDSCDHDNASR